MVRDDIVRYLENLRGALPSTAGRGRHGHQTAALAERCFELTSTAGDFTVDQVVIATGPYQHPLPPPDGPAPARRITQVHSSH